MRNPGFFLDSITSIPNTLASTIASSKPFSFSKAPISFISTGTVLRIVTALFSITLPITTLSSSTLNIRLRKLGRLTSSTTGFSSFSLMFTFLVKSA